MITRRRRVISDSENSGPGETYSNYLIPPSSTIKPSPPGKIIYPEVEMTCRDRTSEFMSAVESLQKRRGNGLVAIPQNRKHSQIHQWNEFSEIAKRIGKDLSNTFVKLEKLTILAKRKSLFDDRPMEIQELTYIIKQDIGSLNKQIAQLQQLVQSRQYQNGKHMQSHSNTVVVSLQSKLASMSNDFKQVLEVRTENLKQQKSRRDQFTQGPVAANLPVSATTGHHGGSVLLSDEHNSGIGNGDIAIQMEPLERQRYQQQLQLIDEQDSYIQSRANTMENIESTIVELGGIFQQLAHMVKEHDEMIQRIDANIDDTQINVEAAHGEILKYFKSVTSNRWLMIKIFGVLIFFFIIFVVFMV